MQITAHNVEIQGRKVILDTHATPYYLNQLTALKGKLKVTIKEYKESKTVRQNNFAWKLMEIISIEQNGSKRKEDIEMVYHQVLQMANIEHETLIVRKEAKYILEKTFSLVVERYNEIIKNGETYRQYDCYTGISGFDTKQMNDMISCIIDYGIKLGLSYSELDSMRSAYDL